MSPCLIIAHRGASAYLEENTLDAFRLALSHGADGIEMDIRQTKDKELIVRHSGRIRKGRKFYKINNLTIAEFKKLSIPIVPLKKVLKLFGNKVILDIDIKGSGFEQDIVRLLLQYKIKKNYILINSRRIGVLNEIRSYWKDAPVVLSFSLLEGLDLTKRRVITAILTPISISIRRVILQRFRRKAIAQQVYGVSLPYTLIYKRLLDAFHASGIRVYAWPPRSEKSMRKLLELGVDGIKTGRTDLLVAEVKKYKNE